MKIFDKILEKHTKINNYKRQSYMINEDIEIIISQEGSKVIMRGFNHKTDRFINFSTKKYKKLMDGFKSASTDLYSDGNHFYYITLGTSNNDKIVENYDLKIEELNKKIDCLNDIIARLEARNNRLEQEVNKYRDDYLYYFDKYAELKDKDFKRTLDDLRKGSLKHNARGAGRKSKFTDNQIEEIKKMRTEGSTIKEIAIKYKCSVGLIHKLINEN